MFWLWAVGALNLAIIASALIDHLPRVHARLMGAVSAIGLMAVSVAALLVASGTLKA